MNEGLFTTYILVTQRFRVEYHGISHESLAHKSTILYVEDIIFSEYTHEP